MKNDERKEALLDLMLAQADVFYRPKDISIDLAIESLQKEDIITELEKIKNEIQDFDLVSTNGNSAENVFILTRDLSVSVIDKHISELKGENK